LIQLRNMVVLAAIFLAPAMAVAAVDENSNMRSIGDGVYTFTVGHGNFSMFVVGEDGVAVFETFNAGHSKAMLAAIGSVTDKPVKFVFQSHNHWDHSSGGKVFMDVGAQLVMHKLAAEWLRAHPGQDTVAPDMVWSGQRQDIDMGDFT
jgi:glyoxylase-like metal-dependent hydrolase (beta-lactamase superfamily II)